MTQYTDRNGAIDVLTYDLLNRRTFAGFGNTVKGKNTTYSTGTITYTWDGGNRLTSAVDTVAGTISRSYDGLDRLLSETTPQTTPQGVAYTYDNVGRRLTMAVPGQSTVNYCWDNANLLNGISQQACPSNPTVGFHKSKWTRG